MAIFSVVLATAAPPGFGGESSAAFVKIDGREALLRSVELFLNRDNVKQIQLVVAADQLEEAKRKYGAHLGFSGVKLVGAGPKWMEQVRAAGAGLAAEPTHVILHDAARPIVPYSDIDELMKEAESHQSVALTAPVRNPLAELDEGGNPLAFHPPSQFVQVLMPQVFSRATFVEMANSGQERHASSFHLVKGSALNIRLGGAGEGSIAKAMLNMLPKPKTKAPSSPFEEAQW